MVNCRERNINNICDEQSLETQQKKECSPFTICLPFNRQLVFDGECFSVIDGTTVPDGEYGVVVVKNNCITGLRPAPAFEYTPPPCVPAATPCNDTGADIILAPGICNMLAYDGAGRLGSFLQVQAGTGVNLSGCGTVGDPLIVSVIPPGDTSVYINSGTPGILTIAGNGAINNPYILGHGTSILGSGTYAGFIIDAYGHIVGYSDATGGFIQSVIGTNGITTNQVNQVVTLGLSPTIVSGATVLLGGNTVTYNIYGQIVDVSQGIQLTPGRYDPYFNYLSINDLGSITAITPVTRIIDTKFSMMFGASDSPSMSFTTTEQGSIRIKYIGNLGNISPVPAVSGLIDLPATYSVRVDNTDVPAYAMVILDRDTGGGAVGTIVEIHAIATARYNPGSHTVTIVGTTSSRGILDVELVAPGS